MLPRHTNLTADKGGFNLIDECAARCVHLFPLVKGAPVFPEGTLMYTSGSIANSQRMLSEINESGAKPKISI